MTRREGAFHKDDDMQGRPRLFAQGEELVLRSVFLAGLMDGLTVIEKGRLEQHPCGIIRGGECNKRGRRRFFASRFELKTVQGKSRTIVE